jgi:TP901 family phage tail tape measure protein
VQDQVGRLYVVFDANGKPYIKGLKDIDAQTKRHGSQMQRDWSNYALKAGKAVAAGMAVGAAAVAAVGVASVKAAASFEYEMSRIKANADGTAQELQQLEAVVLQLGKDTAFSAGEAAQAANELVKAGMSVGDTMAALPGMLALAAAGELGVAQAAEITANQLSVFGLKASDAVRVADTLALAANRSTTNVDDLGMSLSMSASIAAQAGLSIEETSAALALLANNGLKGSDAGTSLKTMLMMLMAPTDEAKAAMEDLGIEIYDSTGKMKSMDEIIADMDEALEGLSEEQANQAKRTIAGQDAIRALNILLKEGDDAYRDMTASLSESGAAQEVAATKMDNLRGSWEELKGSLETAGITMGKTALGPLRGIIDGLTEATNEFVDEWNAMTGTDAWQQGGFEIKFDMAADTIMDTVEGLIAKAGEAISSIDWSAVGETIGESAVRLVRAGLELVVTDLVPMLVEMALSLGWTLVEESASGWMNFFQRTWENLNDYPWNWDYAPNPAEPGPEPLMAHVGPAAFAPGEAPWSGSYIEPLYQQTPEEAGLSPYVPTADEIAATAALGTVLETLKAVYETVVAPADAWNQTLAESKTAAEEAGAAWDESMASLEDYLAKLDEQLAAWEEYGTNLQSLADVIGPELVAQFDEATAYAMIESAMALGPEFVAELAANMDTPEGRALVQEALIKTYRAGIAGAEGSLPTITITPEVEADWQSLSFGGIGAGVLASMAGWDPGGAGTDMASQVVSSYSSTLSDPGSGLAAVTRDALPTDLSAEATAGAQTYTGGWRVILTSPTSGLAASARSAATVNLYSQGFSGGQSFMRGLSAALSTMTPFVNVGVRGGTGTFDEGGMLPPGVSLVGNFTGRPEPVLTPNMGDDLRALVDGLKLSMDTGKPPAAGVDTAGLVGELRRLGDRVEKAIGDAEWERARAELARRR